VAIQYRNRKDDVVTNTSYRRTGFGYGTGVIINLTENILFSIGTQSVKYEDKEVRGKFLNMYDVSLGYQW
jgi:opacity protein-like surface antigen